MTVEALNFLNPYPPYYTRPNIAQVDAFMQALLKMSLAKNIEFHLCAAVNCFTALHPEKAEEWAPYTDRIKAHWSKLRQQTDRPGFNDYHITCWGITGNVEHLKELIKATERRDPRGKTAIWAIENLSRGCPEFRAAITPLIPKTM